MHLVQMGASGVLLYVPGLQSVGVAAPVEQNVPAGHSTHSSALLITVSDAFWWRPAGHGSGADAPSAQ